MIRRPIVSLLLGSSALLGLSSFHQAHADSASDAQIKALQLEMQAMRRDMSGQISVLRQRLVRAEAVRNPEATNAAQARRVAASHGQPLPESYARDIHIGGDSGTGGSMASAMQKADLGTPPSDRGVSSSWASFRAATEKEEALHMGGMVVGFPGGRPTISSEDGMYAMSIGLAFHEDIGGFMGMSPHPGQAKGDYQGLTENARRLRIPISFRYKNWIANITPDFGGSTADGNGTGSAELYEANLNYAGFHNTVITAGYFQPRVTEEDSESSNEFEMMERPAITDIVRNIAAGDARMSFGALHYAKRWWIAGYVTGQSFGKRANLSGAYYDSQTGATFRVAGRPYMSKDIDVHLGLSAISAFKVTQGKGSDDRQVSFSEQPEVDLTTTKLLSATVGNVGSVWSAGPELGFRWKRLVLKGEYYNIGVTRGNNGQGVPGSNATVNFTGYYGAANYTIFGKARSYNIKEGAFAAPGVDHAFDPAHGYWGALEVSARYSVADLNANLGLGTGHGAIRGGQQTVWSAGLNWYPNRHFRFMLDYNHFIISDTDSALAKVMGREGNSVAGRIQAAF
ncbi:OprO/OprP family phosphate-selective porin [Komagataeibacter sp. FNDCF1]|uniref:OprO/OprP family phosphate-selective porin n=1 Tax=Komagataeibacter sp. FNDCF1 TaxID=2878681 RepID=UPI001E5CC3F4|nr:porin [Komagataeibacter sp. FNDCF1]MCE2564057.1 OprO/OprP family phosphate-selective porin [Komagataeibacter sp. FNDCF1]